MATTVTDKECVEYARKCVRLACLPANQAVKDQGGAGDTAERDCACARQARQFVVVSGYLSTCSMPCVSFYFLGICEFLFITNRGTSDGTCLSGAGVCRHPGL